MIKRTTPKYRKITENLQDNSFTGTGGIDISKSATSRETVYNMNNFEVDNDGGLRLRKPLVLKTNYYKLIGSKEILKIITLYDTNSKLIIAKQNNNYYLYCYNSEQDLLPISFYDNDSEASLALITNNLVNGTKWESIDYINTFDSTVITGVKVDLTSLGSKYYDPSIIEEANAKEAYRYFRLEIKNNSCCIYLINPEINNLNSQNTPSLNPNMSLDNAYAIRDNYSSQVVSCEGILAYTLCSKDNLGKPIPAPLSTLNNLTVKVLTESDKDISYKIISTVDKDFTNNVYLKAFLNIKQSEKNSYYCVWEKTYDGVNWEEIDSWYNGVSEEDIQKIDIKIGVESTLETSTDLYQTVRYRKFNCNSENDLVSNRADCLKLDLNDSSLKEATYRFSLRAASKIQYSEDFTIEYFTVNDTNILNNTDTVINMPMNWKENIFFDFSINIKVDDYRAYLNSNISCQLYYRDYTYSSKNNYTSSDKIINNDIGFSVSQSTSTINITEAFDLEQNLISFYKTIPCKLLIMKDNIVMYEKDLVFHCYIDNYTSYYELLSEENYIKLINGTVFEMHNASLNGNEIIPLSQVDFTLSSGVDDFEKDDIDNFENKIIYYNTDYKFNPKLGGTIIRITTNLRSLYETQLFNTPYPEYDENNWKDVCNSIRDAYQNKNISIYFNSEVSGISQAVLTNALYELYDNLSSGDSNYETFKEWSDYASEEIIIENSCFDFKDGYTPLRLMIYNTNHIEVVEFHDVLGHTSPKIDFTYQNINNISSTNLPPIDTNTNFEINVSKEDVMSETKTSLLTQQEYSLPIANKTEVLYNEYGSSVAGEKLYYKKAIYSYGLEQFKNNVFPSDTGSFITSLFNVIELDVTDGSAVNIVIPWRDYLIAASDKSIYLITRVGTSYTTKTINTYIGIPFEDRKTCKAILNGLIFKSGLKLYSLQPNPYSSDDTILNIKEISTPIENYIIKTDYDNFAFTTEKAYYLFLPREEETLCLTYEYARGIWQKYTYPVPLIDYNLKSIDDIILIDKLGKEYYFNKELSEIPNSLEQEIKDNLPYADYIDYTLNDMEEFGTTDESSKYIPISYLLNSGQKTFNIVDTKQFVESKIILTTQTEQDIFPMELIIRIDGSPYPIRIDASTDAPLWKKDIWDRGSLSTNFISEETINNKTFKQGVFRYSGKGKSIEHLIQGNSIYNFKLYVVHYRFKNLINKK